jgi:hypothetical protein
LWRGAAGFGAGCRMWRFMRCRRRGQVDLACGGELYVCVGEPGSHLEYDALTVWGRQMGSGGCSRARSPGRRSRSAGRGLGARSRLPVERWERRLGECSTWNIQGEWGWGCSTWNIGDGASGIGGSAGQEDDFMPKSQLLSELGRKAVSARREAVPAGEEGGLAALDTPPCRDKAAPRMGHPDLGCLRRPTARFEITTGCNAGKGAVGIGRRHRRVGGCRGLLTGGSEGGGASLARSFGGDRWAVVWLPEWETGCGREKDFHTEAWETPRQSRDFGDSTRSPQVGRVLHNGCGLHGASSPDTLQSTLCRRLRRSPKRQRCPPMERSRWGG